MDIKLTEDYAGGKKGDVIKNIDYTTGMTIIGQGKAVKTSLEDLALSEPKPDSGTKRSSKKVTAKKSK